MRVVIAGGPRTGKTTLAATYDSARCTDDLIDTHEWSEVSEAVSDWFTADGPWTIEGVAAVRALRKWLKYNAQGRPCDLVIWLVDPVVETTAGQDTMAKGCGTIWSGIEAELTSRGVEIRYGLECAG